MSERKRATSLSPPERFLLDKWAAQVREAFDVPYLVGSVARAEERWRDVDVRVMLDHADFFALVGPMCERLPVLNVAISLWGQKVTGLPIDFQFQNTDEANRDHDGHGAQSACVLRSERGSRCTC